MTLRLIAAAGALLLLSTTPAHAREDEPAVNAGRVGLDLGVDFYSMYYWMGRVIEDSGVIAQPYTDVSFNLDEGGEESPSIDLCLGTWNSFHSRHTGATPDSGVAIWNEADFYGGVALAWEAVWLDVSYLIYTYPNSDFNSVQELDLTLGVDLPDDGVGRWVGDIEVLVGVETRNSNVADDEASFFVLRLGPSFDVLDGAATLSIPVALDFSIDDFFLDANGDDDFLGAAEIGAVLDVPLASGEYGDWTLTTGVSAAFLGSAMEEANPDGDDVEIFGFVGLGLSY